ncbi:MAG: hypothetical protein GXP48_03685 [Acidobacteria bacterium]|nr:hypothetical protein [Acidobacteriota bacterium]
MEIQARVESSKDTRFNAEASRSILLLGRGLLTELGEPVSTTGNGLSSVVLPAGALNLLVLGIPIPVFGYIGDDDQEIQASLTAFLRSFSQTLLERGHKVVLRAFSNCQGFSRSDEILSWLPRFRNASLQGEPAFLGTELVTLYPFSNEEVSKWPLGPEYLVRGARLIELAVPELYQKLDDLLAEKISEAAYAEHERFLLG